MAEFIAGSFGGIAGVFVGHPFDTVKVRLQTQSIDGTKYKGVISGFTTIIKEESFFALYKGLASPLVLSAFLSSTLFGIQKTTLNKLGGESGIRDEFIAGCTAGGSAAIFTAPMELAKIQLQIQRNEILTNPKTHLKGAIDFYKRVIKMEGIRGPYRGFLVTVCRSTPGCGVYFSTYYYINSLFVKPGETINSVGPLPLLIAGGIAGVAFWLSVYPVDYVKSRIQAQPIGDPKLRLTAFQCIKQCYNYGGIRIFYGGLSATLARAVPANAATLATVTMMTRLLKRNNDVVDES